MAKYEAMLVIKGDLKENEANQTYEELAKIINSKNLKVTKLGLLDLAYEIKKQKQGWYFQMNFECEDQASMDEFRRLSRINKNLLRQLIINLEKDYGYKAANNPKKIAKNEKRATINAERKKAFEQAKLAKEQQTEADESR